MADPHLQRLIELEAMDLDLDPALALSLAYQESGLNPRATSPTGVQGLLQVTKQTGLAYGQDPNARTNPVESTESGLRYLKDLLTKRGGDVPAALRDYNGGSDPAFARNVLRHYEQYAGRAHPALSQPREGVPRPQSQQDRRAMEERIRALEALEAGTVSPSTPAPAGPGIASPADLTIDIGGEPQTPQQSPEDAAAQQAHLLQWLPGLEFMQVLPQSAQEAVARRIPGMLSTGMEVGGSLAGAAVGGLTSSVTGAVGPAVGGVVGGGLAARGATALGFRAPETPLVETPAVNLYPSDLFSAAGAAFPLALQGGKAVGTAAFKKFARAGKALTKAEQATAQQAQAALETYQTQRAAWETSEALKREAWDTDRAAEVLRTNRANAETLRQWQTKEGQRVLTDAENVALTQAAYEDAAGAMEQAFSTQSTANYRVAAAKAKQFQQEHRAALKQFDTAKAQHADAVKRLQAIPERYEPPMPPPVARTAADVQRDIAALDQGGTAADDVLKRLETDDIFEASVKLNEEEHLLRQGATQPIPSPYQQADAPPAASPTGRTGGAQRASAVWYQRLDDMAGTAPVDLTTAHEAAATVQQQLMDMLPSLQDPLARKVVKDLTGASTEGNVAQVHAALKALGRSARTSSNPEHRYLLGQMAEGFQNALEYSAKLYPETSKGLELMQQAKRAWRQEHAVDELHRLFRTSGPIVTQTKTGELKMDVGKLLNRVENLIKGESPSKGSFTSRGALPLKDLMDLRAQLKGFVGTPDLPTQRPTPPEPVPVATPSRLGPPQMPRVIEPPAPSPAPSVVTPPPVEPELPAFGLTGALGRAGGVGVFGGPVAGFAFATADRLEYALSALLLSPRFRPLVLKAIQPGGTIDPQILGGLAAAARQLGEIPEDDEALDARRPQR